MLPCIMFFCKYGACWCNAIYCLVIWLTYCAFVMCSCLQYLRSTLFVCNGWACSATISLSVSVFTPPLDSHSNVASSPMRCLSTYTSTILAIHCFAFPFFLYGLSFSCFCTLYAFSIYVIAFTIWINCSTNFVAILIPELTLL
jgi:hypothetical protein